MTARPLVMPLAFTARDCAVWFEGREFTPAKAALIKYRLNEIGRRTEDVPTLRALDGLRLQLITASVAAVNQRRQALRLVAHPDQPTPPRAA